MLNGDAQSHSQGHDAELVSEASRHCAFQHAVEETPSAPSVSGEDLSIDWRQMDSVRTLAPYESDSLSAA